MSEASPAKASVWQRLTARLLTKCYILGLVFVLVGLEWWAEYWLPLWVLLFAPPLLLLAPLAIISPWLLFKRERRLLSLLLLSCFVMMAFYATYHIHGASKHGGLTVITHNVGQGNRAAFVHSFPDETPDAVLLQDVNYAGSRSAEYQKRYPSYANRGVSQFMLLSPHEIESAEVVTGAEWRKAPIAARFVIRAAGRHIALYSVHLPTPRSSLNRALSPRLALEIAGLRGAPTDGFASYRECLDARITLARQLAAVLEKETLPFLVGGDFNTPDHGVIYHTFASRLSDAHPAAGHGWGFTFPGGREGRLSAFIGPWLRLDYWFAGHGWKPVDCQVAPDSNSQHRAVLARFDPVP